MTASRGGGVWGFVGVEGKEMRSIQDDFKCLFYTISGIGIQVVYVSASEISMHSPFPLYFSFLLNIPRYAGSFCEREKDVDITRCGALDELIPHTIYYFAG